MVGSGECSQGLRMLFPGGEHFEKIVGVQRARQAFALGAAFQRGFLAEQAHGQAADRGEVRGAVPVLLPFRVLAEGHVQHPVLAILDAPVFADPRRALWRVRPGR